MNTTNTTKKKFHTKFEDFVNESYNVKSTNESTSSIDDSIEMEMDSDGELSNRSVIDIANEWNVDPEVILHKHAALMDKRKSDVQDTINWIKGLIEDGEYAMSNGNEMSIDSTAREYMEMSDEEIVQHIYNDASMDYATVKKMWFDAKAKDDAIDPAQLKMNFESKK